MNQISKVLKQHHDQIIRYEEMCQAIQACHAVDEVKEIRDRAMALEVYAAQALNMEAERKACEIRLRAERRAGQLLDEMKRNGERRPRGKSHVVADDMRCQSTLAELGITRDQCYKWQALANVPEKEFEAALKNPAAKPSTEGLIRKPASDNSPQMDPDALWIWGRMRDFESYQFSPQDAKELYDAMTETMQADVNRIAPSMIEFLKGML